MNLKVEPELES